MKIKILYILETIQSGGVEQSRLSLVKHLSKEKYEIKVVCTKANGPMAQAIRDEGVEIIAIGLFKHLLDIKQYKKVLSIIHDFKPDIVHGGVFEGVTMACIAGKLGNVPVIIAEETSDPQNRSKKASFLLKMLTLLADRIIAIAPKVAEYLEHVAHIAKEKIALINYGVDIPRAVTPKEIQTLKDQYHIKDTDIVIGSVGRLYDDHKKFTDIIKAVALLPNNANIKILIVGGGRDEQLIKDTVKQYNLIDNVIMTGFQFDTAPFYKMMDIFCLASQREGFGLVAAEAMLHSLPIVATRVGGLQNVLIENETGFLVPPLEPQLLAIELKKLIENTALRKQMGQAGYVRAFNEFTAEVYVNNVKNLYHKLLSIKNIKA